MTTRPAIFISAVSKELNSARQLVANTLQFLGYEPVWQDVFGTEQGDLREMLCRKIDSSKGVIQLVGKQFGAEPATPDPAFGRVSYTQFEALYARKRGKRVWYLVLDSAFPEDSPSPEPAALTELQAEYRRRLQSETHVYHPLTNPEGLQNSILKLRDDLDRLRRGSRLFAAFVVLLLLVLVGMLAWMRAGQSQQNRQIARLNEKVEQSDIRPILMEVRQKLSVLLPSNPGGSPQDQVADALGQVAAERGLDPEALKAAVDKFAAETAANRSAGFRDKVLAAESRGDLEGARQLAEAALPSASPAASAEAKALARQLNYLTGVNAFRKEHWQDAESRFRRALELTDPDTDGVPSVTLMFALSASLEGAKQPGEASALAVKAEQRIDGVEQTGRSISPEDKSTKAALAEMRRWAAVAALKEEHWQQAEANSRRALELTEAGDAAPYLDAATILILSLDGQERYQDAAEIGLRARTAIGERLGSAVPDAAAYLDMFAWHLFISKRFSESETLLRERIGILGEEPVETIKAYSVLAVVLAKQGKAAEAGASRQKAIELNDSVRTRPVAFGDNLLKAWSEAALKEGKVWSDSLAELEAGVGFRIMKEMKDETEEEAALLPVWKGTLSRSYEVLASFKKKNEMSARHIAAQRALLNFQGRIVATVKSVAAICGALWVAGFILNQVTKRQLARTKNAAPDEASTTDATASRLEVLTIRINRLRRQLMISRCNPAIFLLFSICCALALGLDLKSDAIFGVSTTWRQMITADRELVAVAERDFGEDSDYSLVALDSLASDLAIDPDRRSYVEAESAYQRVLTAREKDSSYDRLKLAETMEGFAAVLKKEGKDAETQAWLGRAQNLKKAARAPGTPSA